MDRGSNIFSIDRREPKPLQSQVVLQILCEEILALRPEGSELSFEEVESSVDPAEIEEELGGIIGDLLLQQGDELSDSANEGHSPSMTMRVGDEGVEPRFVRLRAWELRDPSDNDAVKNRLDILLSYSNLHNDSFAEECISISDSNIPGDLPRLSRHVMMPEYAVPGYGGHHVTEGRPADSEKEAEALLGVAVSIYEQRNYRD